MDHLIAQLEAVKKMIRRAAGKGALTGGEMLAAVECLNEAIQNEKDKGDKQRPGPRLSFWYWYAVALWIELAHQHKRPVGETLSDTDRNALTRQILEVMKSNDGRAYIDYCVEYEVKTDDVKSRSKRVPDLHDLRAFILHEVHGACAEQLIERFRIPKDAFKKEDFGTA